jgi:hypothetical protein
LIKNFCQSRKCQNLALVNRRLRKLAKKGDFRNILDQYLGFTLKRVLKISDPCILWKHFGTKLMIDCKKETIFSWLFIRYYFQLKKNMFWGSCDIFSWFIIRYLINKRQVRSGWNGEVGGQTIQLTENLISMNLLQISFVITWAWSLLTSEVVEAVRGQKHHISVHTLALNIRFIPQRQFCLPKIYQQMRSVMTLSLHSASISQILEPSPRGLISSTL